MAITPTLCYSLMTGSVATRHQALSVGFGRGYVDLPSDRDAAEQIIRKLTGVVGVTNRIDATSASEDCKSQAHKGLQQPSGNISLKGSHEEKTMIRLIAMLPLP